MASRPLIGVILEPDARRTAGRHDGKVALRAHDVALAAAGLRDGRLKLVYFYEDRRTALYDLKADVGEEIDLADRLPEPAARRHGCAGCCSIGWASRTHSSRRNPRHTG